MTHYSLRAVNLEAGIIQFYECEYRNALDALEAAKGLLSDGTVEVWAGTTRIGSFKKEQFLVRDDRSLS